MNEIYRADYGTIGVYGSYIGHSYRPLNSSTWAQNPEIIYTAQGKTHLVSKTADNKIHIIYFDKQQNNYVHRSIDGTTVSGIIASVPFYELTNKLTSNSNDLYLLHAGNVNIPYPIFFRQYDAAPLAPQNLTVSASAANHPLLNWTKNNEADLDYYKIYKYAYSEQGWIPYGTSNTNSFEDLNETFLSGGYYANEHWVYYKVTAVDKVPNPYESPYSNQVGAKVKGAGLEKSNSGTTPTEYALDQNYPNPFNPSTKISYSLKEEGLVTLKVYDILGKEIVTLVNENKPAGFYEAEFNASQLPSGMYIYKIQSGSFSDVKKMLLTK